MSAKGSFDFRYVVGDEFFAKRLSLNRERRFWISRIPSFPSFGGPPASARFSTAFADVRLSAVQNGGLLFLLLLLVDASSISLSFGGDRELVEAVVLALLVAKVRDDLWLDDDRAAAF